MASASSLPYAGTLLFALQDLCAGAPLNPPLGYAASLPTSCAARSSLTMTFYSKRTHTLVHYNNLIRLCCLLNNNLPKGKELGLICLCVPAQVHNR